MNTITPAARRRAPWNKGKLVGQKAPFKPRGVWAMRVRPQQHRTRELATTRPKLLEVQRPRIGVRWVGLPLHSRRARGSTFFSRTIATRRPNSVRGRFLECDPACPRS